MGALVLTIPTFKKAVDRRGCLRDKAQKFKLQVSSSNKTAGNPISIFELSPQHPIRVYILCSKIESIGEKRLEISAPFIGKVCCRRLLGLSLASVSCERADESHHALEAMGGCAEHRFDFQRRCWRMFLQEKLGCQRPTISTPSLRKVCCRRLLGSSSASLPCERSDDAHRDFEAMGGCAEHKSCEKGGDDIRAQLAEHPPATLKSPRSVFSGATNCLEGMMWFANPFA